MPQLEDDDQDPERCRKRHEVEEHGLERQQERPERASEDVGQRQHEGEQVREVAVDGVDEVAVDGRGPADGRVRPFQRSRGAIDDRLDSRSGAVDRGERLDDRRVALAPVLRRDGGGDAVHPAQPLGDGLRVAAVLDEHVERFQHARRDPGRGESVAAHDRVARAGDVLQLGLVRIQLEAVEDEHAGDREPDRRNRYRPRVDESRPATPEPSSG